MNVETKDVCGWKKDRRVKSSNDLCGLTNKLLNHHCLFFAHRLTVIYKLCSQIVLL